MKIMIAIMMIIMILFVLSFLLKPQNFSSPEKKSIFECGFDPNHEKRNSFSLRFFMMTVIFLLFDLEVTFIMPLPLQMKTNPMLNNYVLHMYIIILFVLSTYMEWKMGALSWFW